ncbi:hypothetical protein Nepgr_025244 [Nepenthes gracilis]|uniref:Uncharacterized protein n=1 Tax=Nepenthes gracilis TaxID=150966 RepID=A0AAD3Y1A4_NEPGR|nr:hypothetical protein Nepgr_025244 [Nepenthes gracilis]
MIPTTSLSRPFPTSSIVPLLSPSPSPEQVIQRWRAVERQKDIGYVQPEGLEEDYGYWSPEPYYRGGGGGAPIPHAIRCDGETQPENNALTTSVKPPNKEHEAVG